MSLSDLGILALWWIGISLIAAWVWGWAVDRWRRHEVRRTRWNEDDR